MLPLIITLVAQATQPIVLMIVLHLLVFFVAAMVCHGAIARDRPAPAHLTEFYLWMSVGGVLGGLFNALLAPLLFTTVVEYPLVLVLACLLLETRTPNMAASDQHAQTARRLALSLCSTFIAGSIWACLWRSARWWRLRSWRADGWDDTARLDSG